MATTLVFTVEKARKEVASAIEHRVPVTTFDRWRSRLGLRELPYTPGDLDALACFGSLVKQGANYNIARKLTIQYLEERGNDREYFGEGRNASEAGNERQAA